MFEAEDFHVSFVKGGTVAKHKRGKWVKASQEREVFDLLDKGKGVPAIVRETGISGSKVYELRKQHDLAKLAEVGAFPAYFEHLRRKAMFGSYRPSSQKLDYGPREKFFMDAIKHRDPELASLEEAFEAQTANRKQLVEEIIRRVFKRHVPV